MRLRSITPIAVRLPLAQPIKMAGVHMTATDNLLIRIEDEEGGVGWGEACSAPTMTGETAPGMVAAIRYLAPALEALVLEDVTELPPLLDKLMYGNLAAKSAIETAVYDLLGKRQKRPIYDMLGGRRRDRAAILWMLAASDLDTDTQEARQKASQGFQAFKVKVGVGKGGDGVAHDWARVESVRAATGTSVQISADANQGYSREQGLAFARTADAAVLDFFEQPVAAKDLEAMQAIARAGRVPIGADEGIHSLDDIDRHAAAGAAQGLSLKPIKLGGLAAVLEAARRADAMGMKVNLAGKVADSSIASAAIAHLAVALPQIEWGVSITNQYLAADVTKVPIAVKDGHVTPSDLPGLGVEIDEALVTKFAITP